MLKNKHLAILIICIYIIISVKTLYAQNLNNFKTIKIKVDGRELNVALADTPKKREQGLSGTELIDLKRRNIQGMLFVFEDDKEKTFQAWYMRYDLMLLVLEKINGYNFSVRQRVPLRVATTAKVSGRWVLEVPIKKD